MVKFLFSNCFNVPFYRGNQTERERTGHFCGRLNKLCRKMLNALKYINDKQGSCSARAFFILLNKSLFEGNTCYSSTTSGSLIQIHLHESVCVRLFRSCYSKLWTHFQIVSGLSRWHEWCHHTGKSLVFHWGSCSINKCYTTLMREVKRGLAEAPPAATSHSFIFNEAAVAVLIHPFWLLSEGDVAPSPHL